MANMIELFFKKLEDWNIENLSEQKCDDILNQYAEIINCNVCCPYKPKEYLRGKDKGRTTIHLVRQLKKYRGVGAIYYGNSPHEAKLNMICGFLEYGYFKLSNDLIVINPLKF